MARSFELGANYYWKYIYKNSDLGHKKMCRSGKMGDTLKTNRRRFDLYTGLRQGDDAQKNQISFDCFWRIQGQWKRYQDCLSVPFYRYKLRTEAPSNRGHTNDKSKIVFINMQERIKEAIFCKILRFVSKRYGMYPNRVLYEIYPITRMVDEISQNYRVIFRIQYVLITKGGRENMAAVLQTIFILFSAVKYVLFRYKCHHNLFPALNWVINC